MLWLYLVVESLFGGAEVVPCCKGLSVLLLGQVRCGEQSSTEAQFYFLLSTTTCSQFWGIAAKTLN